MAVYKFHATARSAMAAALIAAFDTGAAACQLKFYDGAQPAGPATAVGAQVLLGTLVCSDPVATEASGVITFSAITQDSSADANGTAAWARLLDGNGVAIADFDVSNNAGGGAIKLNTVNIVAGGPILISSFVITMGGA